MAKFELRGTEALVAKLKKNATLDDVKDVVKLNASELQHNMQRDAPVDTGFLKRSIGTTSQDNGFTARVGSTAEYAVKCTPSLLVMAG